MRPIHISVLCCVIYVMSGKDAKRETAQAATQARGMYVGFGVAATAWFVGIGDAWVSKVLSICPFHFVKVYVA